jgi:hypothetical protein
VDWIGLTQYRNKWKALVNASAGNVPSGYTTGGLSISAQLH